MRIVSICITLVCCLKFCNSFRSIPKWSLTKNSLSQAISPCRSTQVDTAVPHTAFEMDIRNDNALEERIAPKIPPQFEHSPYETLAILIVYFVQGALGLSRLAVTFFLKDELHLNPAQSAALIGLTMIPWIIKPVYGFLSDGFPIFGYRRRSYLAIAGIIGCISWLGLGSLVTDTTSALIAITLGSASIAVSDVVVDSIVVERSKEDVDNSKSVSPEAAVDKKEPAKNAIVTNLSKAGDLQSLCWSASAVGGIFSAYFSGSLLETISPRIVFYITAAFPLLISAVSFFIDELPVISAHTKDATVDDNSPTNVLWNKVQDLRTTISSPTIYLPVLFVFLWQATPSPESAMFYFYTNELGFQPEFLGKLRLVSSIASFAGVMLYRNYLKQIPLKQVLFWSLISSVPLELAQLLLTTHNNRVWGISDQAFTLMTDSVILTVLGQISFMPILALAASLCPPGVEGTLFASLMSIYNLAGTMSSELGAALTSFLGVSEKNFDNLSLLIVICTMSSMLPLPFMNQLLGKSGEFAEKDESSENLLEKE